MKKIIGVISDTHGLIRQEALNVLSGSDIIIHAGDIGSYDIINSLEDIAPLYAVRGNTDRMAWASKLPLWEAVEFAGFNFYVRHIPWDIAPDIENAGFNVVITGHTHVPGIEWRNNILYFNPGSAGPVRDSLPVTAGRITASGYSLEPEIIHLI